MCSTSGSYLGISPTYLWLRFDEKSSSRSFRKSPRSSSTTERMLAREDLIPSRMQPILLCSEWISINRDSIHFWGLPMWSAPIWVEIFLKKKIIEVEIATSCSLEIELSCRRRDSYTRWRPYLLEDGGTYEKIRRPKQKGVELDRQDNTTSPDPDNRYTPLDPSEKDIE